MRTLEQVLWDMHRIANPGEYGLGTEPGSVPDDKKAWEKMGELIDEALKIRTSEILDK